MLSSPADIVIGGGSAGGGKTYALLLDPLHYSGEEFFRGVLFRRTTPQIENAGGLWDKSEEIYPYLGAEGRQHKHEWIFPSGARLKMTHLEHEKNILGHQGAQYTYIGFDELPHFTKKQFFYLLSRNRSPHGIPCLVRATCNPDPDSWVYELISWWINPETGFPIPERDGVMRYFAVDNDEYVWGDTRDEVLSKIRHLTNRPEMKGFNLSNLVKSITFIRGDVFGNTALLDKDPSYLANLLAQDEETKAQLLDGNWKVRLDGMEVFDYYATQDLFDNYPRPAKKRYITMDVARQGRDLAVMYVWEGFNVIRIRVWTKSTIPQLKDAIEMDRREFNISKSEVSVDEGGMGGGLVDEGYVGFNSGASPMTVPMKVIDAATKRAVEKQVKENYTTLKAQCAYRMAERVKDGTVSISLEDVWINGVQGNRAITVGTKVYQLEQLIKQDLRSFRKSSLSADLKRGLQDKDAQKNLLSGRSPDNGDTFIQREIFELGGKPSRKFSVTRLD